LNRIDFRLILVTDRKLLNDIPFSTFIFRCCVYGIKAVQLREKDLTSSKLLSLAKKLRRTTQKNSAKLLINDRIDIALLSKADGVHSPENGTPADQIKKFNKHFIAGKSVHSKNSARKAEQDGYDYLICGPVFRTSSKVKFGKPLGLNILSEICSSVKTPVFAIGGIDPYRAKKCIEAGAHGVAVIRDMFISENLKETISDYKYALGGL
jgi:thiamine-phosphate pyrophosphorylase